MKQILHTPEGVRDIYGTEFVKKQVIQNKLQEVMHLYGYHDIQTPMFEFFDVFSKEIGTTSSKELYKFFDREGNTLVLRPDLTPSIARASATIYDVEKQPARLCYTGNTFINHTSYRGKLRENTQMGVEFIGKGDVEEDAEIITLAVNCLKEAGLQDFQIHIGNVDYFKCLIDDAGLNEDETLRLLELIANKNYFGVEELLEQANAKDTSKEIFRTLPELVGDCEVLDVAKRIAPTKQAQDAADRLQRMYKLLVSYRVEKYITFDLSMTGTYGYYTGIIFRGYTYGTGDAIVKGGRYDWLLGKFGKEAPAIGFAIIIDELLGALGRQGILIDYNRKNTLVVYDECRMSEAISLAMDFRKKGTCTELLKSSTNKTEEEYLDYAKNMQCESVLYLKKTNEIEIINLASGKRKVVSSKIR